MSFTIAFLMKVLKIPSINRAAEYKNVDEIFVTKQFFLQVDFFIGIDNTFWLQ